MFLRLPSPLALAWFPSLLFCFALLPRILRDLGTKSSLNLSFKSFLRSLVALFRLSFSFLSFDLSLCPFELKTEGGRLLYRRFSLPLSLSPLVACALPCATYDDYSSSLLILLFILIPRLQVTTSPQAQVDFSFSSLLLSFSFQFRLFFFLLSVQIPSSEFRHSGVQAFRHLLREPFS